MKKLLSLLLLSCLCIAKLSAQVTGTKTIGTDYATLAGAIADLNTNGISGNVVINVPTGYTETAPAGGYLLGSATLNASTSATSTLTIQKTGATANPVLTAPVGTSTTVDGIFFIQGADYVTIDGIDITEAAGNATGTTQMEFGYALVKLQNVAPFDGCQSVTIKNCTITLNRLNIPSVGIYAGNHIAANNTALTITATTDAMNNCVFRSNTIQNSTTGISLRGYAAAASPYTLYDQNNMVGGSSTTGNIIQNYGGVNLGSGINLQYQNNDTVSYNSINNIAGSGVASTGGLYGVFVQSGTNVSVSVANNIFNLTEGTTGNSLYGINVGCSGTGTVNLDANTFTASGGSTGVMYMIYFAVGNTNINLTNNNFNNINVATTANLGLMYTAAAASTLNMYCNGNYTSGTAAPYVSKTGAGGSFYGYYNASASTAGTTTISNNNISNITLTGATAFIGLYESNNNTVTGLVKSVRNNVVSNIVTGGISAASPCYGIAVGGASTQIISNCQVSNMNGGAGNVFAIYHWVATTDTISNCRVTGITSTGGNAYGIVTSNASTISRIYSDTVSGISTTFATGTAYGIYQAGAATAEIYKNILYDISATASGGSVNGMYLNAGANTVWNNLVGDLRTPAYTTATANSGTQLVGIYCGAGTSYNLYYNTVYLNGTSTGANFGSSAVYVNTGNATFNNNIFINTSTPAGTGMVAAYRRSATGLTGYQNSSNYNLFYAGTPAANQVIMYDGTTAYQTLAAYKTLVTPRDAASVTENVTFQSVIGGTSGFLAPSTTIATQVEGDGINIPGITDDIYGTVRAGNTGYAGTGAAPDLGAVEANYLPLDLSAPSIIYTPFATACATGDRILTATITDVTGVPVSGSLMPRIYYKKGSGSWFSSAGALTSGTGNSGTWAFTIVAADMGGVAGGDIVSYFVIAQDGATTPNLGSNAVGVAATDVNTIGTYPATPNSYPVGYASGTFNVGVGQTFATITAAVNSYNANTCLTGPVTFLLTDATYPGETFPITIANNPLASSTATLTIRPAAGATPIITGSGAPVFTLDGAQYVTIDGRVGSTGTTKALTISNTTTNAANIRFINGASYDTIKYCTLVNVNTATNTGTIFFATSTGATGNSNNLIDNCDFVGGGTPYVQGIYSSGTTGKENINNTVSNCNFADFFSATVATCGINLSAATSGWTITNNKFYQTATRTYTTANTHRAILISNTSGNGFTVNNNIIGYASAAGTGIYPMAGSVITTFRGIELSVGTTTPSSVQGNTVTNMSLSSTTGTITGIYVASGSVNVGTTTANTIGATTGTGAITVTNSALTAPAITGINSAASTPSVVNIQNNNVGSLTATGTASAAAGIWGIVATSSASINISGNTVGSTTTANSINSNFNTTTGSFHVLGINSGVTSATTVPPVISNNIVANLNSASTSPTGIFVAGIIHSGSSSMTISGNSVSNISSASAVTQITGWTGTSGIAYTGGGVATITQNTVSAIINTNTAAVQSNVSGIGYTSSAGGLILRNKIFDLRNASTMTTTTTPPTAIGILIGVSGSTTVANNMISIGSGQTTNTEFMGIWNSGTTTSALGIYHNSINIEGSASAGALPTMGFNRGNNTTTAITSTIDLKNNIINNTRTGGTGKHYAIVNGILVVTGSATGWPAGASNYNILNANASTVGFWSSDKTLATWRTASTGDLNSYSGVTTTFTNTATGDLHMNMGTTPNYIESHGTTVSVTNDYDNDTRPGPVGSVNGGGVLPDLGADEFDGVSIDDVAPAITYTVLPATCSTGDRTLSATIVDQSGVPAAGSGTEPRVYYKKGLAGTWYSRPGTLSSGTVINGTWSFPIVGADMGGISGADRVYYYVAAQDAAGTPNIGANPGTGFAAIGVNTVTTAPTTPNNYFVSYASGTFNVGVGQTFTTITEAVNSYNTNTCLAGPVTFLLTDAAYSASETFPITINNNALASSTVTLTIKPATAIAATVTGTASAGAVFKLLNARYVTVDGVNTGGAGLTLINSNTGGNTAVVWLASTAATGPGNRNISLLNMNMIGGVATNTTNWGIAAVVDGATPTAANSIDNDSITVQGNSFKKCGYALWLAGNAATAAGGLDGWVIRNNLIGPTVYSVTDNPSINGTFMRNMTNVVFSGNTLQNIGHSTVTSAVVGMYFESGIDGMVIDSNIVDTVIANTTSGFQVCAFYFNTGNRNVTISRNRITAMYNVNTGGYGARGIVVNNGTAASNFNIVNNFISDVVNYSSTTLANYAAGISVDGTSGGVNIYNNSINLYGSHPGLTTATVSADILITTTGTGIDVRNNVLVNTYENTSSTTDKTYAIYSSAANTVYSNVDYNDYYCAGGTSSILGNIGGTDRPTLGDMITGFGGNTHSINNSVPFVSSVNLHVPAGTASALESAGIAISGLTSDIDGQVRPGPAGSTNGGGTNPDMGADEFDGVPTDATPPMVSYTALSTTTCAAGDRTLSGVTIADASGVPTTGTTMPRIYYKKNAGSWYSAPGALSSGTTTSGVWSFTISATDMGGLAATDVVSYYVAAQDVATTPNVGSYPVAGFAATGVNTVTAAPTIPSTYTVTATLGGSYTVGTSGAYPTLTSAIGAYNTACLTGPVTFVLTDATYSTGETFPLVIRNNADASSTNTLTIKPAAGVATTITGSTSAAAVFKLLNAQYVTIDGVNSGGSSLSLINGNTGSNTAVVWLSSTATVGSGNKKISLLNMNMTGGTGTIQTNVAIIAGIDGASPALTNSQDNDSVTIQGNTIKRCAYGILGLGTAATSAGGLDGWVVKNNILGTPTYSATDNFSYQAMYLRNMVGLIVSGNTIRQVGTTTSTIQNGGIFLGSGITGAIIDSNSIDSVLTNCTATGATSVVGINVGTSVINTTISRNKILSIYNLNTAGYGARGITVITATAASNLIIVNNFISDVVSYSNTGNANWPIGISVEGTSGGVNIYHNSINLFGTHPGLASATGSADILITTTGTGIDVRNNVLVNSYENTSSTTDKTYAVYSTAASTVFSNIDYNNYYCNGGAPVLGFVGGTDRPALADMISGFGGNTFSINEAVPFVSSTDLHIPAGTASPLESSGTAITGLTTDIDGQVRPGPVGSTYGAGFNPDMGADEFDGISMDGTPPLSSYTALSTLTCSTGDRTLSGVTISDASGIPTTGSSIPRIYFKKNAGTWYSAPGTLTSGTASSSVWSFTVSPTTMGGVTGGDVVSYYVTAQDVATIPNVGSYPGAGFVATDVNTVTTPPTTPSTYTVVPTLSGSYAVGSGGDYATLTAAVNAYNIACLAGNVTFVLTDVSYSTGETFPIVIRNNPNAGSSTTLTIKPQTGVSATVTSSASAGAVFKLLNAQYVTINGLNTGGSGLTLNNSNAGTSAVVWLASTATTGPGNKNIALLNMNMNGGSASNVSNWGIMAGVDGTAPANTNGLDNDSITVQGNYIKKCGYAMWLSGTAATAAGGLNGWVIRNNILGPSAYSVTENLGVNGLFMRNMTNVIYSGNTLQNVGFTTTTNGIAGMYMEAGIDGIVIDSNIMDSVLTNATSATSVWAYYLGGGVKNATISRNKISSVYSMNGGGYGARAIAVLNATAASNVNIVNNFISDVVSYSNTGNANWPVGISVEGTSGGVNIYYNSINLFGTHPGLASATGSADILVTTTGTGIDVRDNLLVNSYENTSSSTDKTYAIYSTAASTVYANIDYNDYYCTNGTPILGYIGGTDRPALADMITGFGGNANSLNAQAVFISPTDLHLQAHAGNVPLIAGTSLVSVTTDIDGTTRGTPPVIGADEVVIPNCSGTPTAGSVTTSAAAGCGTFTSNVNLSGSTFLPGITYQWESSTDDVTYTPVSGATNQGYTESVASTIFYRATLTCTISGMSATTTGLQLTVNPVPAITGTSSVCNGSSTTLGATVSGGTWLSSATTIATVGSASGIVNGIAIGTSKITYTVTSTGCNSIVAFTVNPVPMALAITPDESAICATGPAQLLTALHDSVLLPASIGTRQNINTSTSYPAPFSVYWGGQRTQFLVLASELTALGYTAGVDLTALEFPVSSLGASYTGNNNLMVRIAPSALTSLSAFVTTGLVTVRNPASYVAVTGDNSILFNSPYTWDGSSNLVVDMTFSNNITGSTARTAIHYNTNTSFQSTIVYRADNITAATAASATTISTTHSARADFVLRARKKLPVTWASATGLYTDASASTPYTGTDTTAVYAYPAATTTYTATTGYMGCTSTATATVTVNPLPADIAGANTVCVGSTTTLTNDTTGGTWTSSLTSLATVGSTTGIVNGIAAGVVTMTYTRTATGCFITMQMTVNPLPAAIAGTMEVCESATTTLTNTDGGGTWSSDGTSIAIIGSATGVVTGVAAGFAQMTYTLLTSCKVTQQVTVNPTPVVSVTPTPVPEICFGATTSLTAIATMNNFALMSQDFNVGLGAWTITNIDGNSDSYWQLRASPGYSGTTGDGSQMIQAAPDAYMGITHTRFTSPSFSTVGYGAVTLTFNEYLLSLSSSDDTVAVEYSTDGGTVWSSVLDQIDDIVGSGSWSSSSPEVSVALPAGAVGQPNVKLRWNYYSNQGVWWGVDNIKVTAAQPAPSYTWSGAAGLSCTTCTSVDVTPASAGANVYSVATTTTKGCGSSATATVTVNPLPSAIGGTLVVCEGLTTTATDADAGGTWSTVATSIATVDATTGTITGASAGTAEITYTLPTGCTTTAIITVNPLPAPITDVMQVCEGLTTTLHDATTGGNWISSSTHASVDASGVVTGLAAGVETITYQLATSCLRTADVTVNPTPAAITGTMQVCEGLTTTLGNTSTGGTWASSAAGTASVDATTGVVTGAVAGTATITYQLPEGCTTTADVTVNPLPAPITGVMQVCEGLTTTLNDITTGGNWISSSTHASVDASGVVTGLAAGVETITYQLATSCLRTADVTVNPTPAAITGTLQVCEGLTTTLGNTSTGGTWASSAAGTASVDATTGVVTGVVAGTATITYQLPEGCTTTADVTVNPLPAPITGVMQVCEGLTTTLHDATTGGNWISSSTHASVDASGVVTGLAAGVETITYQLATSCLRTADVTVNPTPAAITGTLQVCEGLTTTLGNTSTGGTWASSAAGTAPVDAFTGIVTGVVAGTATITYQLPEGCTTTTDVTVNPLPAPITGVMQVCEGLTTTLHDATTGGNWISSSTHASVDASGVVTGLAAGVETITYQLATSCLRTADVTVNPTPAAITGTMQVCEGLTTTLGNTSTGGTWASSAAGTASVDATSGVVTGVVAGVATITYQLPGGCTTTADVTVNPVPSVITGTLQVCEGLTTTLSSGTPGGTWSTTVPGVAGVGATTGVVSGIVAGTSNIGYTLTATGCAVSAVVTVNHTPAAITGVMQVCEGATTTLGNIDGGGTWTSGAAGTAGIGSATGIVTGVSTGTAQISYTLSNGCLASVDVTVNATPPAITGIANVCVGSNTTLSNSDPGGSWTSSASGVASVSALGVVSGVSAGTASITYAFATGCLTSTVVTVNPLPATIGGIMVTCIGVTTTLSNAVAGGTWSSGVAGIASVGSATGIVTGVSAGMAPITYTLSASCYVRADVTVNATPAVIAGTLKVCAGSTTALSDSDPGGTWVSSAPGIASISASGVVSGISMGTATISYMLSAGCVTTTVVTVDPLPAPITGPAQLCVDATGTFGDGTPGGAWSSSTPLVATIDNTTGVATAMASGTTLITYTTAAGCIRTRALTVNALPVPITGPSELCQNSTITLADATSGGSWSSGAATVATIGSSGVLSGVSDGVAPITYTLSTGCTAITSITVNPLPSTISGTTNLCQGQTTTLSNTVSGGTWSSSMAATALVNATSGVVTGVGVGSAFISYTLSTGCGRAVAVSVSAMPAAITGASQVCQGATTTMTTTSIGGAWTSSSTGVASVSLISGVVTGLSAGTATISYTMVAGGCSVTTTISVDPLPAAFAGSLNVCNGQTTALSSTPTGGTWTSNNTAVATVDPTGTVSAVSVGSAVISYQVSSGCMRSAIVTVNALPSVHNVTGGGNYCTGGLGVHIGLDNSNGGVNYQLYSGTGAIGSPVAGTTGMSVDFGFVAPIGTYSVVATVGSTGCSSNMTGSVTVGITSVVPASVALATSTASDTVCSGIPVTFTGTATNGGVTPVYQWKVNGIVVAGATSSTYSYLPATGDVVTVNMTSSISCATPSVATAARTMVVNTSVMPVAGIAVTPGANLCEGNTATFSASALFGGSAPVFIWMKNGATVATGTTYAYTPANGDVVYVKLASNRVCRVQDTVSSSNVAMLVNPVYTPMVNVTASPGTTVPVGTNVTLTATVSGGGPSPEFQWYIGTTALVGANSATFNYNMFNEGDSVSCQVKGTGVCGLNGFNSVIMHIGVTDVTVSNPGVSDVRLVPNPNKGEFTVKGTLSVKTDQEVAIEVTNMLGQVVYRTNVMARNGGIDARIKLDNTLSNGMYMLNMISGDDRKMFHFVLEQ